MTETDRQLLRPLQTQTWLSHTHTSTPLMRLEKVLLHFTYILSVEQISRTFSFLFHFFILFFSSFSPDTLGRLGVWQFEGNEKYGDLLHFALNKTTIEHSMVMIVLDFSKPWAFLDSLHQWMGILESSIESLKLPRSLADDLQEKSELDT